MLQLIKRTIRTHRRSTLISVPARMCEKFLHSYFNEDFYDFHQNGESFVLRTFSRWIGARNCAIWDVGANHGQWALEANGILPGAQITSFEVIPALADELEEAATSHSWWSVEKCGMSNQEGKVDVFWNRSVDNISSLTPDLNGPLYTAADVKKVQCELTTVDSYWSRTGKAPDFLKIDAEGQDSAILEGAERLLSSETAPAIIQFEYGHTWIPSQRTLGPVFKQLELYGYLVGRLYPNHVDFRPYRVADEHFRMGNMIAARDGRLRELLM